MYPLDCSFGMFGQIDLFYFILLVGTESDRSKGLVEQTGKDGTT